MRGIAANLILAATAGTLAASPPVYRQVRGQFLAVDLPVEARQGEDGDYRMQHGSQWATIALMGSTPHFDERTFDCGGARPAYRVSKPDLFAYSCLVGGGIIYHVEKYGRTYRVGASNATETIELTVTYPAGQRSFWDPLVAHMSQSLTFPAHTRAKPHG